MDSKEVSVFAGMIFKKEFPAGSGSRYDRNKTKKF